MDLMKNYKQLLKELPSKTVVFAFGRFNPPTTGHELLVKAVKKLAVAANADHAIYASKTQDPKKNPLSVDKKVHYLNLMFPNTHFIAANPEERTFIEAAKSLNKKYKNIIMVAGSDRTAEYEKILTKYNGKEFHFDVIQVISAGERDPDSDDASGMSGTKMRAIAAKGNYVQFKKGLPSTIRDIDGKRLMNDIRLGMGLEIIKENIKLIIGDLREQYFRGEIFNVDDLVESDSIVYKIAKRGTNHLLLQCEDGTKINKWIQEVHQTTREFMLNEDLTTKTLKPTDKIKVARMIATIVGIDNAESTSNPEQLVNNALRKLKTKSLNADTIKIVDKMISLADEVGIKYDVALKPHKHDVAEGIAHPGWMLKQDPALAKKVNDSKKNYKELLKYAGKSVPKKPVTVSEDNVKNNDSDIDADDEKSGPKTETGGAMSGVQANQDHNLRRRKIKYQMGEEVENLDELSSDALAEYKKRAAASASASDKKGDFKKGNNRFSGIIKATKKQFSNDLKKEDVDLITITQSEQNLEDQLSAELDLTDEQIDHILDLTTDDDYIDEYEDDELAIVDCETGEEIPDHDGIHEETLMEVLSRAERMRSKIRFAKTESKRERKAQIAARSHASTAVVNKRARRLAIRLMKKKLLRGRDVSKLAVGEKERIERVIQKRKSVIARVAMKLAPRVRQIEKARLSHTKFTKGAASANF